MFDDDVKYLSERLGQGTVKNTLELCATWPQAVCSCRTRTGALLHEVGSVTSVVVSRDVWGADDQC